MIRSPSSSPLARQALPKGVVLTYGNIASNVDGIDASIRLNDQDVVLGILPLFHSFGYTVTMWAAMTLPSSVVFHYSPLDARQIGKLAEQYKATVCWPRPRSCATTFDVSNLISSRHWMSSSWARRRCLSKWPMISKRLSAYDRGRLWYYRTEPTGVRQYSAHAFANQTGRWPPRRNRWQTDRTRFRADRLHR